MKYIKKGWPVISTILAVICLYIEGLQGLGAGILLATIVVALCHKKSKQKDNANISVKDTDQNLPSLKTVAQIKPSSTALVSINHDLDGTDGSTFGSWDISIHDAEGQDARFDRAMTQRITIQSFDPATGIAEIAGTRGDIYQTDLDLCTCEDFQRRKLPCKHIYKLALARGYSADAFFSTRSDAVWYADGCRVYHGSPACRGLRNRVAHRSTVTMVKHKGLRPCKNCVGEK